jgi:hypothetical protein
MFKISAALLFAAAVCFAQDEPAVQVRTQVMAAGPIAPPGPGGNVMYLSTEMSVGGPTVRNAPFSADVSNEHVQTLADGNHVRNTTSGKIYRDVEGRTRREETFSLVGPWATQGQAQTHTHITITDPVAGVTWDLDQEHKLARKLPNPTELAEHKSAHAGMASVSGGAMVVSDGGVGLSMGPQDVAVLKKQLSAAPGSGNVQTEKLGTQVIEGISAEGTRTTITIPAGAMGNERPIETVSERWYSSDLQTLVMSSVNDPRMGDSTYKLVNISRGDQPASLFEVPSDYQVTDGPGKVWFTQETTSVSGTK